MEVYLDNSATTRVAPEVIALMTKIMSEDYGNAASLHQKGVDAEQYIRKAKEQIAATLKVEPKTIYFTSGGTESNNWAITGTALANRRRGMHLITTVIEHPSVKNTMRFLEEEMGFSVTYLPVDENGVLSVDTVRKAIRPDTILVSVMYVNNEIGALQPIEEIGEMLSKEFPDVYFHVDAIQAYGKFEIRPKRMHIDMLSCSGHKLHGPKGVGFLYVNDRVKLKPIIYGGGQQKGMRSGTENVPGAAGLGLAAEMMYTDFSAKIEALRARKKQLLEGLQTLDGAHVNGLFGEDSAPQIVSCSFDGIRSEVLLHALEEKKIYVSSGSACSSSHPSEVNTLLAIGLTRERQEGTIRFSLNPEVSEADIEYTLGALREILSVLRRFVRR